MKITMIQVRNCFLILLLQTFVFAETLDSAINRRIKEYGAEAVGIYFEDPDGRTFLRNADASFHAASTMKVPVMMEIFRQIEAGKLQLEQKITVKNQFASIVDGSPYSLTPEDDSDTEIYKLIGTDLTLRQLMQRMINRSSNLATNILIEKVSPKNVMDLMQKIGANGMNVLRGVEDIKAYEAGKNNSTTARALALCMKAIMNPKNFKEASQKEMWDILLSQQHREGIAAGIKEKERGLRVASKDGWITEINHDAAIIQDQQGRTSYMVILTRGVKEEKEGERLVRTLASDIWTALQN